MIKLLTMYNAMPAGTVCNFGKGIETELIRRGFAEEFNDKDGDGKAEGGEQGERKAFTAPPVGKSGRRK